MHCHQDNAVDSCDSRKTQCSNQANMPQPFCLTSKDTSGDENIVLESTHLSVVGLRDGTVGMVSHVAVLSPCNFGRMIGNSAKTPGGLTSSGSTFAICTLTKGWVPVFAHGWDHQVDKTGTFESVGGIAFLSVILCNVAGRNIGTTILLSHVFQTWVEIHRIKNDPISQRTF
ncbi:hypothetical protein VTL71DRAFT_2049 [Oculimacula yallundae]|uniref:Uncharacterized protein n=1 Tax=Oculimacula yallundae TaxID=86028 RepID=A0ABR4C9Z0_9HELO